jgi:hypothetical protein
MKKDDISRRDFGKLSLAAFGGLVAGSVLGSKRLFAEEKSEKEMHACCGLISCNANGASGDNKCAGMGNCATVEAHGCSGHNDCKNQGGSGDNDCKGKGSCSVPIKGDAWKKARAKFEERMKKDGKEFGDAPASCSGGK